MGGCLSKSTSIHPSTVYVIRREENMHSCCTPQFCNGQADLYLFITSFYYLVHIPSVLRQCRYLYMVE